MPKRHHRHENIMGRLTYHTSNHSKYDRHWSNSISTTPPNTYPPNRHPMHTHTHSHHLLPYHPNSNGTNGTGSKYPSTQTINCSTGRYNSDPPPRPPSSYPPPHPPLPHRVDLDHPRGKHWWQSGNGMMSHFSTLPTITIGTRNGPKLAMIYPSTILPH